MRALLPAALVAVTLAASCGGDDAGKEPGASPDEADPMTAMAPGVPLQPQEARPADFVRGSGRSLSGAFEAEGDTVPGAASRYVFTDGGAFLRAPEPGADRESGTYVIDGDGRLVLYVERRGDAVFSAAEREVAAVEVRDDGLTIGREGGAAQRYRKVAAGAGDAPPPPE